MRRMQEKKRTARENDTASARKLSETWRYLSHMRAPCGQYIALRHSTACRHRARCGLVLDEEVYEGEEGSEGELHDLPRPEDDGDADEKEATAHLEELPVEDVL